VAERPALSVVVPSVNGWRDLEGCLRALAAQEGSAVEVIVADRVGAAVRGPLRAHFPDVVLLEAAPGTTIPALRRQAFRAARADVVGVIEDHVLVPPDWARRMLAVHAEGHQVVGGAVENAATGTIVDWSAFLCEYHHCLTPPRGTSTWVTGNNVTYRRALLERFADVLTDERWENHLHDAIRDAGIPLESRPELIVGHKKHYTAFEYVGQRYLYSRSSAGARLAGAPVWRRAAYGAAAAALPPVLLWRIVRAVRASGRFGPELVRSAPLLLVYVVSWAAGEMAGAWFGAGNALGRVT
jgi:glycosyltransferase involved in cell wall biosynthesis